MQSTPTNIQKPNPDQCVVQVDINTHDPRRTTDDFEPSPATPHEMSPPSVQRPLPIPGRFDQSSMFFTPDSTLDELADPQYDHPPKFARAFVSKCLVAADAPNRYLPDTLKQAMRCDEAQQWKKSMQDEMKSILENKTWSLVPAPNDGAKVIEGRWVFRTKTDASGKQVKYKSRWVVRDFQQEEGSTYTSTLR